MANQPHVDDDTPKIKTLPFASLQIQSFILALQNTNHALFRHWQKTKKSIIFKCQKTFIASFASFKQFCFISTRNKHHSVWH